MESQIYGDAVTVPEDLWDAGMAVLAKPIYLGAKSVVPVMRRLGGGVIVNLGSVHSVLQEWNNLVYETGNAAVLAMTRQMAIQDGPDNIRVNAVGPGHILTEGLKKMWAKNPTGLQFFEQTYPLRRSGTTEEAAEGAEVGLPLVRQEGHRANVPVRIGLSYTTFDYSDLKVEGNETITATFTVKNTGKREGADVPQLYLTDAAGDKRMCLLGFERVVLKPGESRKVMLTADPRLLARFDGKAGKWSIAEGKHKVAVGKSSTDLALKGEARLSARQFGS
jgi:hypothetical protein